LKVSKDLPGVPLAGFSILVSKMKRTMKIEKQELHYFEDEKKKKKLQLAADAIDRLAKSMHSTLHVRVQFFVLRMILYF
jgi:hypothetical protein